MYSSLYVTQCVVPLPNSTFNVENQLDVVVVVVTSLYLTTRERGIKGTNIDYSLHFDLHTYIL